MPNEEIKEHIIKMNEEKLDEETCKTLCELAPTTEEIEMLNSYDGDVKLLDKGDAFMRIVSSSSASSSCFLSSLKPSNVQKKQTNK